MGEGSRGTLCFVRRASLTKRRCQFVDGMRRETEETGVLWWWVGVVGERGGQEWESSSLFTGCCGRRGAVGENDGPWEWVVSLDSTSLVPARWNHVQSVGCCECCDHSLDQRNCCYGCTRPLPERDPSPYVQSRVLLFFTGSTKGSTSERRNGKEHRAAMGGSRWQQNNTNKN